MGFVSMSLARHPRRFFVPELEESLCRAVVALSDTQRICFTPFCQLPSLLMCQPESKPLQQTSSGRRCSSITDARTIATSHPRAGGGTCGSDDCRFTETILNRGSRIEAAGPVAPTQDMTITELTHAYQHLAAQSALDKQWAG